jgi:hypothetical protein
MRWLKPNLRSSINALLAFCHSSSSRATPPPHYSIEDIREAMLVLIQEDTEHPHVKRRIRYALDVQALWYLRGDLMAVLAGSHGEVAAREKLTPINSMFEDLLPEGLRSRPSPLSSATKE